MSEEKNIADFEQAPEHFAGHPELEKHLGWCVAEGLLRRGFKCALVDKAVGRRPSGLVLLALGLKLSERIQKEWTGPRVGIILPPGFGGAVANLGALLAGKVPVNLNFTSGADGVQHAMQQAGLTRVLSSRKLRKTLSDFGLWGPEDATIFELETAFEGLGKPDIFKLLAKLLLFPKRTLRAYGVPEHGGDAEAVLLFSSGSSGTPKGVPLSHRNLIGNILQAANTGMFESKECLLLNLPLFHSFGLNIGLLGSLCRGLRLVCVPSPLDYKSSAANIEQEACSLLLGTPTFLRPYLKLKPEQLASLKNVIVGAEKTPKDLHETWSKTFPEIRLLEGYGLTETSPLVAVNLPDSSGKMGSKLGSVGPACKGISVRVKDAETQEQIPHTSSGLLHFKGVNVFSGYLKMPELSAKVIDADGWFCTGDLGHVDADGFLFIEGRLSRFSKIGGEMVPHLAIEAALLKALGHKDNTEMVLAVAAVPSRRKGEELVVLSTLMLNMDALGMDLRAQGLPNLWVPKRSLRVESIPMLASGKLDLKGLQQLAEKGH